MVLALWIVGGWFLLIWCGTWALQIALWLVQAVARLVCGLAVVAFGLVSLLALAVFDRKELGRIWRRRRADQAVAVALARERWS